MLCYREMCAYRDVCAIEIDVCRMLFSSDLQYVVCMCSCVCVCV